MAAATLALGLAATFWFTEPGLTQAQPPRPRRTPAEVQHEQYVLGSLAGMLRVNVDIAEHSGRIKHLETTAAEGRATLPMTLATDPYLPAEIALLSHAQRELESYLAVQPRTHQALAGHYKDVRKAVRDLNHALESVSRERGRSR